MFNEHLLCAYHCSRCRYLGHEWIECPFLPFSLFPRGHMCFCAVLSQMCAQRVSLLVVS